MLSAVAARKLAQSQQSSAPSTSAAAAAPPPKPAEKPSPSPSKKSSKDRSPAKRRLSSQGAPKTTTKKPRRSSSKSKQQAKAVPQYFGEPHSVVVDDDAMSVSAAEDDEEEALLPVAGAVPPVLVPAARAYSPSRPVVVNDSSDEEDSRAPAVSIWYKPPLAVPEKAPVAMSSFRPTAGQNIFVLAAEEHAALGLGSDKAAVLLLSAQETFSFAGCARLRVLRGAVTVLGTTLHASSATHDIFAPLSSPIPTLQPSTTQHTPRNTKASALPSHIERHAKKAAAVIALQEMNSGVAGLGRVVRTFQDVFSPSSDEKTLELPLSGITMCLLSSRDIQPFVMPQSWEDALCELLDAKDEGGDPPICLVKGPKNAGKSTFARTLVNRLSGQYRRVAYLDCDLGQSEFNPGGMVALTIVERPLFGPPFTHTTVPYRAHYIGSTSPRSSPSHYLSSVEALLHTYRLDLQHGAVLEADTDEPADARIADRIPLVINTMGWSKGLGADLTHKIEQLAEPSAVFSFHPEPTSSESEDGAPAQLYQLAPVPPPAYVPRHSAADHRALSIMSYFHACFPPADGRAAIQRTATQWDVRVPLCALPPYEIDTHATLRDVVLAGAGAEDVVPAEIVRVLNGAVVALVHTEADADMSTEGAWVLPYTQGAPPPDPATSECIALALVRGVSPDGARLQLLTPLPANVDTIVKGELEVPIWGLLDHRKEDLGEEQGAPFLRWGKASAAGAVGGEKRRVRRNLMRKGQM